MTDTTIDTLRAPPAVSDQRWPELNGWRAMAIISVMVGHFIDIRGFNAGRFGVELFFVLSGLLMANILFVKKEPLVLFFKRRIARVWPALFVFLAIMAGVYSIPASHVIGAIAFVQNYVSIYAGHVEVIDHLWSLSIEEWTYIFLGAVAFLARRNGIVHIPVLCCVAVLMVANGLAQTVMGSDYYAVYWRTDVRAASILMGAVAFLLLRNQRVPSYIPLLVGFAGLILNINHVPDPVKYSIGTAMLAVSIATISQAPQAVLAVLGSKPLGAVATISFSLYLWQQPFFKAIGSAPTILLFAGAIVCATMSYILVEKPFRALLTRAWAKAK